jgi:ABC-2 type transport system ATP-binding protein
MTAAVGPVVGTVALCVRRVGRRFCREQALAGVDLNVCCGEVHALVGLNGAGKSTLMRLMLGTLKADVGRVEFFGTIVNHGRTSDWGRVGHLIEAPSCYPELTVREQVRAAARLQGLSRAAARSAAEEVIEHLELGHWRDRRTRQLSLGNRQRLGIACALVHRPDLLVLDEPSNGLDPSGVVRVRELLRERAREQRAAVLVSSHHLDEVARMADRITVLHRGRVVGKLDPNCVDVERQFFAMVLAADVGARPDLDIALPESEPG